MIAHQIQLLMILLSTSVVEFFSKSDSTLANINFVVGREQDAVTGIVERRRSQRYDVAAHTANRPLRRLTIVK